MVEVRGSRFDPDSFAPIAVATRSDTDESLHLGAAVVVAADGSVVSSIGNPELAVFPRSALKPFQTSAMVGAGLDLEPELLAVVSGSHSGEARHLAAVTAILDRYGLSVADLANAPDRPYGTHERVASIESGTAPSSLQQNCSGKHAGMLATCRINDWSIDSYLDPEHPLQEAITDEIDRLAARPGGSVVDIGVDGCGAPSHVMPLVDVARALGALARDRSPVVESMMAYPAMVGGTDRDVSIWMEAVPGLVAKEGAAGVMVAAMDDGRAVAMKIADGSDDARRAVTPELLRRLGVDVDGRLSTVRDRVAVRVLGHGAPVGAIVALAWPRP